MAYKQSKSGIVILDKHKFPSGIKLLIDTIHGMRLKFAIYKSARYITCQKLPGSLGSIYPSKQLFILEYKDNNARLFSSWG